MSLQSPCGVHVGSNGGGAYGRGGYNFLHGMCGSCKTSYFDIWDFGSSSVGDRRKIRVFEVSCRSPGLCRQRLNAVAVRCPAGLVIFSQDTFRGLREASSWLTCRFALSALVSEGVLFLCRVCAVAWSVVTYVVSLSRVRRCNFV